MIMHHTQSNTCRMCLLLFLEQQFQKLILEVVVAPTRMVAKQNKFIPAETIKSGWLAARATAIEKMTPSAFNLLVPVQDEALAIAVAVQHVRVQSDSKTGSGTGSEKISLEDDYKRLLSELNQARMPGSSSVRVL